MPQAKGGHRAVPATATSPPDDLLGDVDLGREPCSTYHSLCSECSPGDVPRTSLTTAVHNTLPEAPKHLSFSEAFQKEVLVNQSKLWFGI